MRFIASQKQKTVSGWGFASDPTGELTTLPRPVSHDFPNPTRSESAAPRSSHLQRSKWTSPSIFSYGPCYCCFNFAYSCRERNM